MGWGRDKPEPSRPALPETHADPEAGAPLPDFLRALPRAGDLIDGQYRIVGPLGSGAMGTVLRAVDQRLRRDVAIKFLKPEWARLEGLRDAFMHEARALASSHHTNVVELFDMGEHNGLPYFAMAYLEGPTLREWIEQRGAGGMSFDEAMGLIDQICQGVAAIHEVGLVHGDLKPANILTGENYRVAVSDLGLAGLAAICDRSVPTMAGSEGYTAPEARLGRAQNLLLDMEQRVDVWAISAVAYELLAGRQLMRGELRGPGLGGLRPDLPDAICEAVEAGLISDPRMRTATAEELRDALWAARPDSRRAPASSGKLVLTPSPSSPHWPEATIVHLDDDPDFLDLCGCLIEQEFPGAKIRATTSAREALEAVATGQAILITDLDMPEMDGFDVTTQARGANPKLPIVVISGKGSADLWRRLRTLGADACLLKPTDAETLGAVLRAQADRAHMRIGAA